MPKLWAETVEAHRREVRDTVLDAAAALVTRRGLRSVTMSELAEEARIGRATLYRYFPDVDSILVAWHERQIRHHLDQLAQILDRPGNPTERLEAFLEAYALIRQESGAHPETDVARALHRGREVAGADRQLQEMLRPLLSEGVKTGAVRDDVAPEELATYCLHALAAAATLPSKAAVHRLVDVTMGGLRPPAQR